MKKQSPVMHKFPEVEYVLGEVNEYLAPLSKRIDIKDAQGKKELSLRDMSSLQRLGFRGTEIVNWLKENHGIDAPPVNQAILIQQDLLIIRLSQVEIFILQVMSNIENGFLKITDEIDIKTLSDRYPEIYYLPRQDSHACFLIHGDQCANMFSKLCAIELSIEKFSFMDVTQTSMAGISVIIVRHDIKDIPTYSLLVDSSLAEYLWECLLDAMDEYKGQVKGIEIM